MHGKRDLAPLDPKNEKSRYDYRNSRELSNGKQEREITGIMQYWSDGKVGRSAAMQQ
jgi:hypothetical protein